MKISKSKHELARIISENGGWRDGEFAAQNGEHGRISFSTNKPVRHDQKSWMAKGGFQFKIEVCKPLPNWHQTILSRDEYFHLYPAPDADGWIEWNGGGCPVPRGTLVDVKYSNGITNVGVSALTDKANADHVSGSVGSLLATNWDAGLPMSGIIAYRPHKPEQIGATEKLSDEAVSAAKDALMSNSIEGSVRKPTIEQLAADYRNAKDYADRKQAEADAAKADADGKLKALELAGNEIGIIVSPITEVELGDEVECIEVCRDLLKCKGMRGYISFIDKDCKSTPYLVDIGNSKIWCRMVKLISRK